MIGDVFLVRGGSKASTALVNIQKVIYSRAKSSHVEFYMGDGILIHSTSDKGVHLEFLLDELKDIGDDWRVLRLKGLSDEDRAVLQTSAVYFKQQQYNPKFMFPECDDKSFCSELIAKIYARSNVKIFNGKRPGTIKPADFDRAADHLDEWEDVTHEYSEIIKNIQSDEMRFRQGFQWLSVLLETRLSRGATRGVLHSMILAASEGQGKIDIAEAIDNGKRKVKESRRLHFWNEKDL